MEKELDLIRKERERQIKKGYTIDHDDNHIDGELVLKYGTRFLIDYTIGIEKCIPKGDKKILPDDYINIDFAIDDLTKLSACIVAEMERLERLKIRNNEEDNV